MTISKRNRLSFTEILKSGKRNAVSFTDFLKSGQRIHLSFTTSKYSSHKILQKSKKSERSIFSQILDIEDFKMFLLNNYYLSSYVKRIQEK